MKNRSQMSSSRVANLSAAAAIIERQRRNRGKPLSRSPRAIDLVHENLDVIKQLRDADYRQEDAVLLLLDLGNDAHKPDTLRKAIAAALGPWVQTKQEPTTGSTAEAIVSESAKDARPTEEGPEETHAPARAIFSEEDVL